MDEGNVNVDSIQRCVNQELRTKVMFKMLRSGAQKALDFEVYVYGYTAVSRNFIRVLGALEKELQQSRKYS